MAQIALGQFLLPVGMKYRRFSFVTASAAQSRST
jgi:hypothetical protein